VGELAVFSIRQEAMLSACEARRAALVETVDAFNAAQQAAQPKRRALRMWPFGDGS